MTQPFVCPHQELCCSRAAFEGTYAEQLTQKRERVAEVFARYPQLAPQLKECAGATPPLGYRTRAKLAVGPKGELGLFTAGTHAVVDLPRCAALSPAMQMVADGVREELSAARIAPYSEARGIGLLRGIDIRESAAEKKLHLTLILNAEAAPLESAEGRIALSVAEALMSRLPMLCGVAANLNPAPSPQALGPRTVPLTGEQFLWEELEGARLRYSPGTFAQAHRGQAAHLVRRVRALLQPTPQDSLLDLYSGVGMFSLALAKDINAALLVESFPKAADDAQASIDALKSTRLTVLSGSVEEALRELSPKKNRIAVINPPRRGLSREVIEQLARLLPERLVYVSCDPDTLARDVAQLSLFGLRLAAPLEPVDMIPLTEEVETLALLRKGAPAGIPVLYQDEYFVAVDKPWGLSIHRTQQDDTDDLTSRLSTQLKLQLHPVHRLDRDTSGVAVYAKSPEATRALSVMLANDKVEREYLALVKGSTRDKGNINRPLRDQGRNVPARTRYKRLARPVNHSLLVVEIETGRTHQIRRHLEGLGHPVIGDQRYGDKATNRHFGERYGLIRPFLHAHRLAFIHPFTKATVLLRAPLPGDLATLLARTGEVDLADQLSEPLR